MNAVREKSYKEAEFQDQAYPLMLLTGTEGGWFPLVGGSKGSDHKVGPGAGLLHSNPSPTTRWGGLVLIT